VSRDARHRTGRDADFRAGRRRRPLLNPRKSGNRPVRTRLLVVLGELVQTTAGKWIDPPADALPERAHPRRRPGPFRRGIKLASAAAVVTPRGRAGSAIRRCTGRRSTRTARRSMGQRLCGSRPRGTDAETPGVPPVNHTAACRRTLTPWPPCSPVTPTNSTG
jgi:hypothetical protein